MRISPNRPLFHLPRPHQGEEGADREQGDGLGLAQEGGVAPGDAGLSPRREWGRRGWAQWRTLVIRYMPAEVMIMYGCGIGLFAMLEPDENLGMGLTGFAVAAVGAVFTWLRLRSL